MPGEDYTTTSGSLTFETGELSKSFTLQVINDNVPEVAEYIFIAITTVQLDPDSVEEVDNSSKHYITITHSLMSIIHHAPPCTLCESDLVFLTSEVFLPSYKKSSTKTVLSCHHIFSLVSPMNHRK